MVRLGYLVHLVLRGLEIIGEATKSLSEKLKTKYLQVPWKCFWMLSIFHRKIRLEEKLLECILFLV